MKNSIPYPKHTLTLYTGRVTCFFFLVMLFNTSSLLGNGYLDSLHHLYLQAQNTQQEAPALFAFAERIAHVDKDSCLFWLQNGIVKLEKIQHPTPWDAEWREKFAIAILKTLILQRRHLEANQFLEEYESKAAAKGWLSLWESQQRGYLYIYLSFNFFIQRDFDKAQDYARQAFQLATATNDLKLTALCKVFFALEAGNNQNDFDKEKTYSLEAIQYYETVNDQYAVFSVFFNLILSLNYQGNYEEAYHYIGMLKQKRKDLDLDSDKDLQLLSQEIKALTGLKKFRDAEKLLEIYADKLGSLTPLEKWNYYLEKSRLNEAQGNFEDALSNFKKYRLVLDSIRSSQKEQELLVIQENLNLQKIAYEKRIAEQESLELKKQNEILRLNTFLVVLLALAIIVLSLLYYRRKKQKQESLNLELQHKLLQLQMKPHFFFNALSIIPGLILQNKNDEALEMIENLGLIFREALIYSRKKVIDLRSEIHFIEAFLRLHQLHTNNKFYYNVEINKNVDVAHIQLPPFLIQPLIENAFKHGHVGNQEGGTIKVIFKVKDNLLHVVVKNQNSPLSTHREHIKSGKSLGLSLGIIEQRIKLIFRGKGKLSLKPITNGFQAQLELPLSIK